MKLTPKKCELFKPSVKFLGKLVTGEGYTMAPVEKAPVRALQERTPATVGKEKLPFGRQKPQVDPNSQLRVGGHPLEPEKRGGVSGGDGDERKQTSRGIEDSRTSTNSDRGADITTCKDEMPCFCLSAVGHSISK